jgi:tetratricopeptide (TPR) repeat protein
VSLTLAEPAAPLDAQEDSALLAMRRAIVRAREFTLLLAVCNSPARRDQLIERLSESLPDAIRFVDVPADCDDVLGLVLDAEPPDDRSPIAVSGLERGILAADFCHPRIAALNQRREEWRDRVRVPVIFWIPEYFLRPLARGAPDFLDWRVGTFLFVAEKPVVEQTRVFRADLDVWRHTTDERAERIAELRALIARFASGPHGDDQAVVRWRRELARHLLFAGDADEAFALVRDELLPACHRLNDERLTAESLDVLADLLFVRGELDEALRIRREEELPIYERLGDVRSRAVTMGKIADILQSRGELDEALRIRREEELPVYERLGDVRSRAVTMGQIADILQSRGELDEALRIRREEELPVYERLGDVRSRAVTMGQIADILQSRGELDEALRIRREEELPVYERLGDVRSRAVTMGKIADILRSRGELDEALRIRREEQLPVYERLGDVRELLVGRANLAICLMQRGAPDDLAEARRLLGLALEAAIKMRLPEVRTIQELLDRIGAGQQDAEIGGMSPTREFWRCAIQPRRATL